MAVLVTGGAGYIGSHTCLELLNQNYEVVVIDNLSNSSAKSIERVEKITGRNLKFYKIDLLDQKSVENVFKNEHIEAVIHFAGLKVVGKSIENPIEYYQNNVTATLILCDIMKNYGVKDIVFSSSATVYGEPVFLPITEDCPVGKITNPYGQTKAVIEQILKDIYISDNEWNIVLLRYFNPIGAHISGMIGEDTKGTPNNLLPYITKVAMGELECINIFGNDYDTPDGTGVRDYIHVVDLALGHIKALKKIKEKKGVLTYNLGTGKGYTVMQVIHTFEKVCGKKLKYEIKPRRKGDVAVCYADVSKAKSELGWEAEYDIERMCEDAWRWQLNNPKGYEDN